MARSENTTTTKIDTTTFTLELPDMLKCEPLLRVQISKKRTALVYRYYRKDKDGDTATAYYDVHVVTPTGATAQGCGYGYRNNAFTELYQVRQHIIDISAQLNVRRKTRKMVAVEELDEDDED